MIKKEVFFITITLLLLLLSTLSSLFAYSAGSLSLSGSYSLRASGCEANYWNPANLAYPMPYRYEVLLINSSFSIENNAYSIDRYNKVNGTYLTDGDKKKLVDDLKGKFSLSSTIAHNFAGISFGNFAASGRINIFAKGNLSSRYMELILFGNKYDYTYSFDKKSNNIEALGYADLTFGYSPYSFEIGDYTIHTGFALSFLGGLGVVTTDEYKGFLTVNDDGTSLEQSIILKNATSGFGLKSLIGFRSDINENLSLGLSVDNLAGFIYWTGQTEKRHYTAQIDSLYIAKLDSDVLESTEEVEETGNFTTTLPVETTIAALYRMNNLNLSLDWKQGFANSVVTSKTPDVSMGAEYYINPNIPLKMGFNPGLGSEKLYNLSYGAGYESHRYDIYVGIKSIGALIPGSYSKGVALAVTSKLRF